MSLKAVAHYGPVTAVLFDGPVLYVGQGGSLKLYDWYRGELIYRIEAFKRDKIHGIVKEVYLGEVVVAVWGGRSLSLIKLETGSDGRYRHTIRRRFLNDWIASLTFCSDKSSIYVQTSHNRVLTLDVSSVSVQGIDECSERSILYSGTILSLEDTTLVASGTVLHGVVVWNLETKEVLHNFTSHEGSIFGVTFSSDGRLLASCSDDRSIILWDVVNGKEIAIGWGHHARIWKLLFVSGNDKLISVSEDCTARVWSWAENEPVLVCEQVLEGHLGRNIWCGALNENGIFATGGTDGRVKLWDISFQDRREQNRAKYSMIDTGLDDLVNSGKKKEVFKNYALVNNKHLIVGTSHSRLLFFNGDSKIWKCVPNVTLDFYSLIRVFDESNSVAITTKDGKLFIVNVLEDIKVDEYNVGHHFKGKLSDLKTFSIENKRYVLMGTQNPDDPVVIYNDEGVCKGILQVPSKFHAITVVYDGRSLYLGSRYGALAMYSIDFTTTDEETKTISPLNYWRKLMSDDAITSIICSDSTLTLTSRGGYIMKARVTISEAGATVTPISLNKLPKCDIEGSSLSNNKLILYGFRNDLFFVWNHTDQYEVLTEKCGGAHRIWHFQMNPNDEDSYDLLYTKATEVNHIKSYGHKSTFKKSILQPVTHGREIRGLEFAPTKKYNEQLIFATGSEDTCIALHTVDAETAQLTNWGIYEKHISGITALHWSDDSEYLISSSGQEELNIWKIVVDKGLHAYPASTLPTTCDIPDLRIMNFSFYKLDHDSYLIVSIYSDSTIRGWVFDSIKNDSKLVFSGRYRECCLLNCDILLVEDILYLATSSTDGHLAIWTIGNVSNFKLELSLRLQLHQSSIKDSFFHRKSETSYIYVSGGDDNGLTVAEITFNGGSVVGKRLFTIEDAHSSTITGVKRISNDRITFVTTSSDQNLKLWEIKDDRIELVDSKYTTVADTGLVDVYIEKASSLIAIGGLGISFWNVEA